MANKQRLIDANALYEFLEMVRQDYREEDTLSSGFAAALIETVQDQYLAEIPTVDAVEVVRCKDCKHYKPRKPYPAYNGQTKSCCRSANIKVSENDFCSYGERKDND